MDSPLANHLLGLEPFVVEFYSILVLSSLSDFCGSVQVQNGWLQHCADL
jgi:hypothetical protein